jgi:hypothetical protein
MRSFLSSRRRTNGRISLAAGEQRLGSISPLGFTAAVFVALLAACDWGQAQTGGMPNSPGPVQRPQTSAAVQRAQVIGTTQGTRIKITAQHAQPKATVQRGHIGGAQRAAAKPASSPTVGSHTAAKPARPDTAKTATPVPAPAKTAMPVPAPELLASPAKPNCAFDSARTDADDRQKLDYERQCYRHAEMILRDRLERLQGDVEEMIKAAKSAERVSASR